MTTPRLLLVLQFFPGDRAQAMALVRLWADLEPEPNRNVDVLLSARFDTDVDEKVIPYVSRKFGIKTFVGRRRARGWPFACNEQWFDTVSYVSERISAGIWPKYDAMLTTEADSIPLVPRWTDRLLAEWDRRGVCVLGHWTDAYIVRHINGNAMFSCKQSFLQAIARQGGCDPCLGWDVALTKLFQNWGQADTVLIRSYWHGPVMTPHFLDAMLVGGTVFYHGIKDMSGIKTIRQRYLDGAAIKKPV